MLETDTVPKSSSFNAPPPPRDLTAGQHARCSSESAAPEDKSSIPPDHRHGDNDAPVTIGKHDSREEAFKGNDPKIGVLHMKKREAKEAAPLTSDNANLSDKFSSFYFGSVTLKEINFSIITSEDMRVLCSIVLAVVVVLYHVILPLDAARPRSLIAYKPLYVLLLTDVFIVGTKLAPFAQRRMEEKELPKVMESEDGQDWGGAIRLMELGLVLHQTIRAVFIDLSFYVAIVICGLHLI